jgi:hypothetical protein
METLSMPDRKDSTLPFESSEATEQKLWAALSELPREAPSPQLRRSFYQQLEQADSTSWHVRLRHWLGLSNNAGWVTVTACLLMGFGAAQLVSQQEGPGPDRLAAMEQNIALLNRELVLDRLQDDAPGTRLLGIHDASTLVEDDPEVTQALLLRASQDASLSVRSAAIDALGPRLTTESVGAELMRLLESAESPLVQMALVDLVLRNGSPSQVQQLLRLANEQRLHPDLVRHVKKSLGSETV